MIKKLIFILCFSIAAGLFAQNTDKKLKIEVLLELKSVSNPQISPDGNWVAFVTSELNLKKDKSQSQLWMVPTAGGEAIPMTSKEFYSASEPRWSPDNKYLSFLGTKHEEKTQVYALNRLGGDAQQLTKIKQGVKGYEWAPNGQKLLLSLKDPSPEELTEDKEDDKKAKPIVVDRLQFKRDYVGYLNNERTHLYTYVPGDSTAVQITFGDYDDVNPAWHPDSKTIVFESNRTENPDGNSNTDIWLVSTDNPTKNTSLKQLTTNPNADKNPVWSPDGKTIAFTTITDGSAMWYATQKLAMVGISGREARVLGDEIDRNISKPKFSMDGKSIYFLLEEQGTSIIASIDVTGKGFKRTVKGEFSIGDYDVNGSLVVPLLGKVNHPNEIYTYQKNNLKQLTTVNGAYLENLQMPRVENINFKSKDGTPIEGFVVKPVGFDAQKKYPLILWLHGGPVSQYEFEFNNNAQLFAANGYVTLLINPRGSSGYGQAFSQALFADWGNKDVEDVLAGLDYIIEQGYTDPNRLGVGGWSYGGILTNYLITKSNRFKAAISGASEALYRANYGHDHYQLTWEIELGLPWENAEAWERISPFNDVANITTPTLWIGGSDDWNVPILNSEQMYQAMKRLGRETQLVVYPGESHGIQKPSFIKDRYERYLQWFSKYLK
ncbi:S9 family peptidase [Arenibacter certesii]|uniref:Acylaminoacyl-peptidase n=1 Tax=Arenibacter certesii TaxID=228955 RepID=A0A918MIH5_9FLAO|nr:S9 family peptidase [Arenibacter certesii]GGW29356.1 acylaminoacyl-peptidase [Arenibacter certesii]